jgi:hypothetical protein
MLVPGSFFVEDKGCGRKDGCEVRVAVVARAEAEKSSQSDDNARELVRPGHGVSL